MLSQPAAVLAAVLIGIRLALLLPRQDRAYLPAISATLISGGFGIILPFRAGEALKILVLRKRTGMRLPPLLGAILLERAGDVLVLTLFGALAIFGKTDRTQFVILLLFVAAFLAMHPIGRVAGRALRNRTSDFAKNAGEWLETASAACTARSLLYSSITSIPAQVLSVGVALVVMHAVAPEETTLRAAVAIWFGTGIGLGLSVAPAGLGTFEAGGTAALMALGWPLETALEATVSLHIAYFILLAPIGGLLTGIEIPNFFSRSKRRKPT